jgi:hypothetical protein
MQIAGTKGLSPAQLEQALLRGGRVVLFQYCVSIGIMTFKRPSRAFYVPVGGSAALAGLPTTLLTLVAGWWGIPWGPIYTIQSLITNLSGGRTSRPTCSRPTHGPAARPRWSARRWRAGPIPCGEGGLSRS